MLDTKFAVRVGLVAMAALCLSAPSAHATAILIDEDGDTGTLLDTIGGNDALLFGVDGGVLKGVGNSKVFLTVNQQGNSTTEQGYNTDGTVEFETVDSGTESLLLSDVPLVSRGGVNYYEFAFALNQTGGSSLISFNAIQLFQADSGSLTGYPGFGGQATQIFNWASDGDTLTVDDFVSGLSDAEMLMLVPQAAFGSGDYVMLYMNAGDPEEANAGNDKWLVTENAACLELGLCETPIPEPGTLLLLGLGMVGLGLATRRHRRERG
jgi:PEP-CTERM motif